MDSTTTGDDPKTGKSENVGGSYRFGSFPDSDELERDGDIVITAMIPRPPEMQADVQVAVDGTVCFKVPAKQCRIVWRRTRSGRTVRVQECVLGEVTICMDRTDWG